MPAAPGELVLRHPADDVDGGAAFVVGEWARATDLCERALTILREQCSGVVRELTLAQNFVRARCALAVAALGRDVVPDPRLLVPGFPDDP
jgi:hypothetical protein